MSELPPSTPPVDVGTSADLAWLLATGAVRGKTIETPALMLTGVAGTVSGALVPVTFPSAGGGGYTVSLPWINEPPMNGDNVLVAHIGQARIVLGPFLKPEDVDLTARVTTLESEVGTITSEITEIETDITDLETLASSTMYVENVATGLHFFWTGGVVSKTANGSGNCSISFGEPGTTFSYPVAPITAWCQGASGGAPIAVNVGALNIGSLDLHLSGLEGTVVPGNSFSLIYGVIGY